MKQPYNTTIYNTALYMRLSRDDENYGDSVSIETQRTILQQYAKEQGLHVVGEYVDDGWSGTNFERPDFQRMMDDVEAGKVNCIVTKDLSRFGREHVMMDYYLEFLFPEKRVRYIAVAENEDTEKGLSDFVPFKNLFNEWFAKDTSRKVKAAFKAKFATGQRIGAYAPIGYRKHPEIKNKLIIDEETRWIVEKIFERAQKHPEIIPDLKKLMNYYLPMTVKLLDAYEEMDQQPVQGENIQASKKEIEDTLDTLNQAFEKLLDSAFQDTAWDVSSDISVLHTLLAQEGLTDDDFAKMKKN